ncbi:hypothetical protein Rs2_23199 [Raphanus sativus]|nr:hypothetical protein Rs2_23199 [Raphanus sativus]
MGEEKPIRLLNFVSEEQLEESKKERGERVEDGTFQRDRALYEILKENKDKKDAEFNERFKHRPPKALDEEETEFLDKLEMSRKQYERKLADEEEEQLRSFQEPKTTGKRNASTRPPFNAIIKIKSQPKKVKASTEDEKKDISANAKPETSLDSAKPNVTPVAFQTGLALVSYSDESEDDD